MYLFILLLIIIRCSFSVAKATVIVQIFMYLTQVFRFPHYHCFSSFFFFNPSPFFFFYYYRNQAIRVGYHHWKSSLSQVQNFYKILSFTLLTSAKKDSSLTAYSFLSFFLSFFLLFIPPSYFPLFQIWNDKYNVQQPYVYLWGIQ